MNSKRIICHAVAYLFCLIAEVCLSVLLTEAVLHKMAVDGDSRDRTVTAVDCLSTPTFASTDRKM